MVLIKKESQSSWECCIQQHTAGGVRAVVHTTSAPPTAGSANIYGSVAALLPERVQDKIQTHPFGCRTRCFLSSAAKSLHFNLKYTKIAQGQHMSCVHYPELATQVNTPSSHLFLLWGVPCERCCLSQQHQPEMGKGKMSQKSCLLTWPQLLTTGIL